MDWTDLADVVVEGSDHEAADQGQAGRAHEVRPVLAGGALALVDEAAAGAEAAGAGSVPRSSPGEALGGGVAGSLAAASGHAVRVGELDHVEQGEGVQEPAGPPALLGYGLVTPLGGEDPLPDPVPLGALEEDEGEEGESEEM